MTRNDFAWGGCIFLAVLWMLAGNFECASAFLAGGLVLAGLDDPK